MYEIKDLGCFFNINSYILFRTSLRLYCTVLALGNGEKNRNIFLLSLNAFDFNLWRTNHIERKLEMFLFSFGRLCASAHGEKYVRWNEGKATEKSDIRSENGSQTRKWLSDLTPKSVHDSLYSCPLPWREVLAESFTIQPRIGWGQSGRGGCPEWSGPVRLGIKPRTSYCCKVMVDMTVYYYK